MTFERVDSRNKTKESWDAQRMYDFLSSRYSKRSVQQIWDSFQKGRRSKFYDGKVTFEVQQEVV